jgi:hypothetical protein
MICWERLKKINGHHQTGCQVCLDTHFSKLLTLLLLGNDSERSSYTTAVTE